MRIVYLGKKPWHGDRWFNTGKTWEGHGDVQVVPDDVGRKMIEKFPTVYGEVPADSGLPGHETGDPLALFGGGDVPPSILDSIQVHDPVEGRMVPLGEAKFAQVKTYVEAEFGVAVRVGMSRTELLELAVELLQAGKGPQGGPDPAPGAPDPAPEPAAGEDPPPPPPAPDPEPETPPPAGDPAPDAPPPPAAPAEDELNPIGDPAPGAPDPAPPAGDPAPDNPAGDDPGP